MKKHYLPVFSLHLNYIPWIDQSFYLFFVILNLNFCISTLKNPNYRQFRIYYFAPLHLSSKIPVNNIINLFIYTYY